MSYRYIRVETRDSVGLVTLDRPKALNALCDGLIEEIVGAVEGFDADEAIGAVVITGSDKAFAAGADIREIREMSIVDAAATDFPSKWQRIGECRKPVIAAVAGYALGGGCELAMMCDFILAADSARFGQPEIGIGTIPGAGGTQRLTRFIGKSKAMEMCLTGRMMDAEEAERCGLVSRVVPAERLLDEAMETAAKIAALSRPVVMLAKRAVNQAFETPLAEGLRFERSLFHVTGGFEDREEGMAAFLEKRKPAFKHR